MSKEVKIIGASGYTSTDIKAVLGYINENKTRIRKIVTNTYPLTEIEDAFKTVISGKEAIKVLVDLT